MEAGKVGHLKLFRPETPHSALGLAVSHLMTKPAFAELPFGSWSKILVGQINRKHYAFIVDEAKQVQGFVGWALATEALAEAWMRGRSLSYEESLSGECLVFNVWSANTNRAHRYMVDQARRLIRNKKTMYFQRYYPNGNTRPVRLPVNEFVVKHIERRSQEADVLK